jgi:hypothetical protein
MIKLWMIDGPISPHALVTRYDPQNATESTAGGEPKSHLEQIKISVSLFIAMIGGQLQVQHFKHTAHLGRLNPSRARPSYAKRGCRSHKMLHDFNIALKVPCFL